MFKIREHKGFHFKMSRPELKQYFSLRKTAKYCDEYFSAMPDEIAQMGKIIQYHNEAIHFLLSWEYVFIRAAIILGLFSISLLLYNYTIVSCVIFLFSVVCYSMTQKIKRRIKHYNNSRFLAEYFLNETLNGRS